MNYDLLIENDVDVNQAIIRFANNKQLYEKFLIKFTQDETFGQLKASMENREYEKAFCDAHTLKGIAGNLSLNSFYDTIEVLVEYLRNGSNIEAAIKEFSIVQKSYNNCIENILEAKDE